MGAWLLLDCYSDTPFASIFFEVVQCKIIISFILIMRFVLVHGAAKMKNENVTTVCYFC